MDRHIQMYVKFYLSHILLESEFLTSLIKIINTVCLIFGEFKTL